MRPWALVTGASSGIGRELAWLAAEDGHDLVLVARNPTALESVALALRQAYGCATRVVPLDLGAPGGADALADALEGLGIVPAFLANNAGVGAWGPHLGAPATADAEMLELNVIATTRLLKRLAPAMVAAGQGRILNVASMAAFAPGPWMAVYAASKAYLVQYSLALGEELRGSGVTVTALCPGPTPTAFQARAGMPRPSGLRRWLPATPARAVALAGYAGARRGRALVVPGPANGVLLGVLRLLPRRIAAAWYGRANRPG